MHFDTLLCILLYLGSLVSPGSYSDVYVDQQAVLHQAEIDNIHIDPPLEQAIVQTYSPQLEFLDIYPDEAEN